MYALSKGFKFIIRCNYTSENLHSFEELISIFTEYADECIKYKLLTFSYHKVWQVKLPIVIKENANNIEGKTIFLDKSFDTCYADKENSVVINYNGDVYNCTDRDFKQENREGYLNDEGVIIYNERHQRRMEARFSNQNCLNCRIFPICNICSQIKLEHQNNDVSCLRMMTDKEKEMLLSTKIQLEINDKMLKNNYKIEFFDEKSSTFIYGTGNPVDRKHASDG